MIWLKRIALFLAALLLFVAAAGLFVSKERLCNLALQKLAESKVTLCYDERKTSPLGCEQKFTTVLYGHSPVAAVKSFTLQPWRVEARGVRLEGMAAKLVPPRIESVRFDPLAGTLHARGDFGELTGTVAYAERKISLALKPSSLMKRSHSQALRQFRYQNGAYRYELAF